MVRLASLLVLLAVAPGGSAAEPDPVTGEAIDAAVRRAVAWLRGQQEANGAFGSSAGESALALLALRHAGVPRSDRTCERAARYLERALPDGTVYGAALGTLALLAQSPERHRDEIAKLVGHLVKGQCRNGQWTYAYRATARKKAGDNSNTQLAVLALAAARVRRVEVDAEAFRRCREFFRASQNEDGGFGYAENQRRRSYGSMTAGGAMALALTAAALDDVAFGDAAVKDQPDVARALAWLARDFDAASNRGAADAFGSKKGRRGDNFWKHYWLWSLERACAAAGADRLADHDWYREGARHLLATQREDGRWRDPEKELQATCFALLFFSRSTRAILTPRDRDRIVTTK